MCKELYITCHEELVDQYLEEHPDATWQQAYDATADGAFDRMGDKLAEIADMQNDIMKGK